MGKNARAVLLVMGTVLFSSVASAANEEWKIGAIENNSGICGNTRFALLIEDSKFPKSYAVVCIPKDKIEDLTVDLEAANSDLAGKTFSAQIATKSPVAKELVETLGEYEKFVQVYFSKR